MYQSAMVWKDSSGSDRVFDLDSLLEKLKVYYLEIYDSHSSNCAALWRLNKNDKIIVINRYMVKTEEERRWVIAHCLGHIVFNSCYGNCCNENKNTHFKQEYVDKVFTIDKSDNKEYIASDIALNILIPRKAVLEELKYLFQNEETRGLTYDEIVNYFIDVFCVPRSIVEYRLKFVKLRKAA